MSRTRNPLRRGGPVEGRPTESGHPGCVGHPIMRFKGVTQGEPDSRDDALRVDEILAGRDNNADSDLR